MSDPLTLKPLTRTSTALGIAAEVLKVPSKHRARISSPSRPDSIKKPIPKPVEDKLKFHKSSRRRSKPGGTQLPVEKEMLISVRHLEERCDKEGYIHVHEYDPTPKVIEDPKDSLVDNILYVVRHFSSENKMTHRTLVVRSPHLKAVLNRVIGEYPTISFRVGEVVLEAPFRCLYHYLDELLAELEIMRTARRAAREYKKDKKGGKRDKKTGEQKDCRDEKRSDSDTDSEDDEEGKIAVSNEAMEEKKSKQGPKPEKDAIDHLKFLIGLIKREFRQTIQDADNYLPHGLITYSLLWTIFKPNTTIYTHLNAPVHARKLIQTHYTPGLDPHFQTVSQHIEYGGNLSYKETTVSIDAFSGCMEITKLPVFPLKFHPNADDVRRDLILQGRKLEEFVGQNHLHYNGVALGELFNGKQDSYNISGRVILGAEAKNCLDPAQIHPIGGLPSYTPSTPLTDDGCLYMYPLITGFSLTTKKWLYFHIKNLSPISWDPSVFSKLAVPDKRKSLIKDLVQSHFKVNSPGPAGSGLVFLLHGPPGVCKTATASTIAEHFGRPMYTISPTDLGTNPTTFELTLTRVLEMATAWNAIVLLDNFDAFLGERLPSDLTLNTFLRLLENYNGILFITANSVSCFNQCFKHRAFVTIEYSELDKDARVKVWEGLINLGGGNFGGREGEILEIGPKLERNAWQIRSWMRIARGVAVAETGIERSGSDMERGEQDLFREILGEWRQN